MNAKEAIWNQAQSLIHAAANSNLVLTIELVPNRPLAMGDYRMKADVRDARHPVEPVKQQGTLYKSKLSLLRDEHRTIADRYKANTNDSINGGYSTYEVGVLLDYIALLEADSAALRSCNVKALVFEAKMPVADAAQFAKQRNPAPTKKANLSTSGELKILFQVVSMINTDRKCSIHLSDQHLQECEGYISDMLATGFKPTKINIYRLASGHANCGLEIYTGYSGLKELLDVLYNES